MNCDPHDPTEDLIPEPYVPVNINKSIEELDRAIEDAFGEINMPGDCLLRGRNNG